MKCINDTQIFFDSSYILYAFNIISALVETHKFAASNTPTRKWSQQNPYSRERIKGIKCSLIVVCNFNSQQCLSQISLIRTKANTAFAIEVRLQPVNRYTDRTAFPKISNALRNGIHVVLRIIVAKKFISKKTEI